MLGYVNPLRFSRATARTLGPVQRLGSQSVPRREHFRVRIGEANLVPAGGQHIGHRSVHVDANEINSFRLKRERSEIEFECPLRRDDVFSITSPSPTEVLYTRLPGRGIMLAAQVPLAGEVHPFVVLCVLTKL
jgi:hypothetical protein